MWDPNLKEWFTRSTGYNDSRWWNGEAIWETAGREGVKSGVCFWPGSEVPGKAPTYYLHYDKTLPYTSRVAQIVEWLSKPKKDRPRLLMLYMEGVDTAGHAYGPDSPEVNAAIEECDVAVGELVANVTQLEQTVGPATIVVISDHGMTAIDPQERAILVEEDCGITLEDAEVVETGPVLMLNPSTEERVEAVLTALRNCSTHMSAYTPEGLPERMHFVGNPRISKVVGIVEQGWSAFRNKAEAEEWSLGGNHGYDPEADEMHGFLVATGNGVHSDGRVIPRVPNVDIYEFVAKLLGLKSPASTNTTNALATYALSGDSENNNDN